MTSLGKELRENRAEKGPGVGWGEGVQLEAARSQPRCLCSSSPRGPPPPAPPPLLHPSLLLLSRPGSAHCPLGPPAPPHFTKPCPLCTAFTPPAPGAQRASEPPPTHMHARAHTYTHTVDTTQVHRAAAPRPPRGLCCPWRSGPSRHLRLPWVRPLPSPGPRSTPGTALKKTGDGAPLAGLWRGLPVPVWLSRPPPLLQSQQVGKVKGQSRKMAPTAPPPELAWRRRGLVLPRNGAQVTCGPLPGRAGRVLPRPRGGRARRCA